MRPPWLASRANGALSMFMIGDDTALYRYNQGVAANKKCALNLLYDSRQYRALDRYDQPVPNGDCGPFNFMDGT